MTYLMPEDGQCDGNMWHMLTGLIKFVVIGAVCMSVFRMCHNRMNFTKKESIYYSRTCSYSICCLMASQ